MSLWGVWLLCKPDRLRKSPKWLQILQTRFLFLLITKKQRIEELSDKQIRNYARRILVVSFLMVLAGLIGIVMGNR